MKKITASVWRRFETVVFLAIKSILNSANIEDIQEKLTEQTNDGGYDGSFLVPCITDKGYSQSNAYYKILFEAKLRKNIDNDLPLQDFSKALIIAINMDSDALIVATNLRLSDGTKAHLRDFSRKTGLKTYYLSPYYIDKWMENNFSSKNRVVDKEIRNLLRNASAYSNMDSPLELLKSDYVTYEQKLPVLLGRKRQELLKKMLNAFKDNNGMVIVKGEAGIGKSFFCSHLLLELERKQHAVYIIDLKNYHTPRVLFIKLLESLWHIPFETLISLDQTSLNAVIKGLDSHIVNDELKEAILSAFSRDLEHYSQSADILNYYMIKYLLIVHKIRSKHAEIILFFSNVSSLSSQMAKFILHFLNEYTNQGKVILELRTSAYIDLYMKPDEWNDYLKQFVSMETVLYQETIEPFSHSDAYKYIRSTLNLPNPDIVLMDAILHVTGYNPLFIGSLVEYLNISNLTNTIPKDVVLQRLEHLIVDDKRQIISMLIATFCKKNNFFAHFFEAIRIFQVPIKEKYISQLLTDYHICYIDQLVEANLICRISDNLEVVHPLQFECILNSHSLMDYSRRELAQKILDTLDKIALSAETFAMIQIRCYRILNKYQKIIDIEYPLAIGLLENGQYTLCYEYAKDAVEKIEKIDPDFQMLIHLKILLLMVEICIYQEEDAVSEIDDYMEKLRLAVECFSPQKKETLEFDLFMAQYYMTKNRYEHFIGEFEQAFVTLEEALEFAKSKKRLLGNQVIGNIQVEYAIALKEKADLEQSLAYLKTCLKNQPNNPELLFTFHTQMYELNLLTNPKHALKHTEENRHICKQLSIATTMHNEVHWLNAQYYMKNYDICFVEANSTFKKVEQIGLKNEVGRLSNLLGNLFFLKKDFANAKVFYEYGIGVFQEKGYISNIWALLINMSTLLTELKDETAIKYIYLSIDILSHSYRERIQKPYPLPGYYEKLQVAVIILYYNIRKLGSILPKDAYDKLLDIFSIKLLNDEMQQWLFPLSCEEITTILKDTNHYHSPYLLLGN